MQGGIQCSGVLLTSKNNENYLNENIETNYVIPEFTEQDASGWLSSFPTGTLKEK